MLDQTFTTDNFKRIYDLENRRGVNVEEKFFPTLAPLTEAIREQTLAIKAVRSLAEFPTPELYGQVDSLKAKRRSLQSEKNGKIDGLLEEISQKIREKGFSLSVYEAEGPGGKKVYPLLENAESFFVSKQLQRNLHRLYGVKQSNRHQIVNQLKEIIGNSIPKVVVRTDISKFYESINRVDLMRKISSDQLVSLSSKNFIKQILQSYGDASNSEKGIPRGVGISAYLSELFMRSIDRAISELDCVIYYARYVDDMVVVFAPSDAHDDGLFSGRVKDIIEKSGLTQNPDKTDQYKFGPGSNGAFEYLGYNFQVADSNCSITISNKKISRYKDRISACFNRYDAERRANERSAHRRLVTRLRFLTGNTQLSNSKQHAMTGIYFSNSAATDVTSLGGLDAFMKVKAGQLGSVALATRIDDLSFKRGFEERTFHQFSARELKIIVSAWKYAA